MTQPQFDLKQSIAEASAALTRYQQAVRVAQEQATRRESGRTLLDLRDRAISHWSVGEHLQHLLAAGRLTFVGIDQILRGKSIHTRQLTGAGRVVLESRQIPSGAPAPEGVRPSSMLEVDALVRGFDELRKQLESVESRSREASLEGPLAQPHFALGNLDAADWLRFTAIHTDHHFDIANRIIEAAGSSEQLLQ